MTEDALYGLAWFLVSDLEMKGKKGEARFMVKRRKQTQGCCYWSSLKVIMGMIEASCPSKGHNENISFHFLFLFAFEISLTWARHQAFISDKANWWLAIWCKSELQNKGTKILFLTSSARTLIFVDVLSRIIHLNINRLWTLRRICIKCNVYFILNAVWYLQKLVWIIDKRSFKIFIF